MPDFDPCNPFAVPTNLSRHDFEYMRYSVMESINPHHAKVEIRPEQIKSRLEARLCASFASREMKPETTTEITEYPHIEYCKTLWDHFKFALKNHQFFGRFGFVKRLRVEMVSIDHVKTVTHTTRRFHVCPHNFYMGESRPGPGNCLSFMTCGDEDKRRQEYYLATIRDILDRHDDQFMIGRAEYLLQRIRDAVRRIDEERGVK